ncbi:MAG: hypothetical protein HDT15_02665 [Oscillibacter sp.]|nr:hypothetical protein [Oscillibacter sp.]
MTTSEKIILAVLVIFAVLMWLMPVVAAAYIEQQERKKRGEPDESKAQYDERQKLIRLEASSHALYALGGYLLVWMVLEFLDVLHWGPRTLTLLAAGLLLAVVVWNSECILRDAMLGFNQRKSESGQIIMYFSLGLCWLVMGGSNLEAMSGSLGAMQMLMGASFLIQGGLMLYARHRRKLAETRLDTEDGAE